MFSSIIAPTTPIRREINNYFSRQVVTCHSSAEYSRIRPIYKNFNLSKKFTQHPNIMDEYQADQSLSTMSNIIPLSSESTNPMRNILQYPLCVFATSSRPEFTEHLISHCTPKQHNNSNHKTVLAHLPVLKSPLNPNGDSCSSFTLTEHETEETGETDESSLRASRVNPRKSNVNRRDRSFRKTKNCKQCNFIASTKMEYWEHMRCHIKGFTCSKCSFVTKYKHHMNHHWLSVHDGSKPFKCKKCLYTCVSKSMLTSHLKKHSNIYPYRCTDCTYKTKFCNALKKHLRKKEHQPAMVLNADGSPNPLSIIDVYGTKRGPKQKLSSEEQEKSKSTVVVATTATTNDDQLDSAVTSPLLSLHSPIARRYLTVTAINGVNDGHWINQSGMNKNQSVATFPYSDLVAAFNLSSHVLFRKNATFYKNLQRTDHAQSGTLTEYAKILNVEDKMPEMFAQILPITHFDTTNNDSSEHHSSNSVKATSESSTTFVAVKTTQLKYQRTEFTDVPLDLRMAEVIGKNQLQFRALARISATSPKVTDTNKRKGKAIKLERHVVKENTDEESEQNGGVSFESPPDSTASFRDEVNQRVKDATDEAVADLFDVELTCHYCEIIFGNVIMYAMHMGCHSFDDPYTCKICGQQCIDKLSFFLHIARSEH